MTCFDEMPQMHRVAFVFERVVVAFAFRFSSGDCHDLSASVNFGHPRGYAKRCAIREANNPRLRAAIEGNIRPLAGVRKHSVCWDIRRDPCVNSAKFVDGVHPLVVVGP
jgi:hypothetical protein